MRHRCLSEGRWPEKQEEWGAGLGREGDTGAEVGVGLDVLEWRWAICPSVHPSPTRARHSSGPWESSRAETDKLPAFVEGLAINMKANRHWKEQQVRRAGGRGDASGEGSGEASEKGSVS